MSLPVLAARLSCGQAALSGLPALFALIGWFGASVVVQAQTNDEINAGLQFSFTPPGAKSLAMGGAFVGLADDATAAFANPAGLLWLPQPEVSVEGRQSTFTTFYPNGGSFNGIPTRCESTNWHGPKNPPVCADMTDEYIISPYDADTSGAAFLSYVHLFKKRAGAGGEAAGGNREYNNRWRLALFRHELANFRADIDRADGFFFTEIRDCKKGDPSATPPFSANSPGCKRSRASPVDANLELSIDALGAAVAFALSERKRLWAGVSVSYYGFTLESETRRYLALVDANANPGRINPTASPEPASSLFRDSNEDDRHLQSGDDDDVAVTAGLLWKSPNERFSVGAVYRQGPTFDFDYDFLTSRRIPGHPGNGVERDGGNDYWLQGCDLPGDECLELEPNNYEKALSGRSEFPVPDVVAVGMTYKPVTPLTLSFEYARVGYSSLEPENSLQGNDLISICRNRNTRNRKPGKGPDCSIRPSPLLENYHIDDAEELHLGLEYEIDLGYDLPAINLRAGAWLDPDHQLRYDDPLGRDNDHLLGDDSADRLVPRYPAGDDEVHLTAGVGIVSGERFQIDLGADLSDRSDIYSLSTVFRWGRAWKLRGLR